MTQELTKLTTQLLHTTFDPTQLQIALKRAIYFRFWLEDQVHNKNTGKVQGMAACSVSGLNRTCYCIEGAMLEYFRIVTGRGHWSVIKTTLAFDKLGYFDEDPKSSYSVLTKAAHDFFVFPYIYEKTITSKVNPLVLSQGAFTQGKNFPHRLFILNDDSKLSLLEISDLWIDSLKELTCLKELT